MYSKCQCTYGLYGLCIYSKHLPYVLQSTQSNCYETFSHCRFFFLSFDFWANIVYRSTFGVCVCIFNRTIWNIASRQLQKIPPKTASSKLSTVENILTLVTLWFMPIDLLKLLVRKLDFSFQIVLATLHPIFGRSKFRSEKLEHAQVLHDYFFLFCLLCKDRYPWLRRSDTSIRRQFVCIEIQNGIYCVSTNQR